ncbi:hypothetical protein Pcinc_010152 [Petrolisthes cinctipes]|uniref:Uncharacterized protein n=1 Tax=Petrolisthes cinctipes TaxID=88211 RepID=A0AAE1G5F7_PETCI|nr:hypothetical protein Pcinc_010152 [Petrolisthes cinctipes]
MERAGEERAGEEREGEEREGEEREGEEREGEESDGEEREGEESDGEEGREEGNDGLRKYKAAIVPIISTYYLVNQPNENGSYIPPTLKHRKSWKDILNTHIRRGMASHPRQEPRYRKLYRHVN